MPNAVERNKPAFVWRLNWKICLFSLFFFPLFVGLGFWQLQRAEQKRTIQQHWQNQQALPPQVIDSPDALPLDADGVDQSSGQFRKVELQGQYHSEYVWLVENRSWQGRLGYHVIQAFYLNPSFAVLVNRGWVAGSVDRSKLPDVVTNGLPSAASGQLVQPSVNRLLTGQTLAAGWPKRILQVEPDLMARDVDGELADWILEIDAQDPAAEGVDWQHSTVSPTKHLGYAVQWFSMAFVLLILTLYANSNLHAFIQAKLKR